MFESKQKRTNPDLSLSDDLLQFYQDFAEFNEYHAFFCDAFAGVVTDDEVLDARTVHGINRCSRWMKTRMAEFQARIKTLQDKSRQSELG